MNFLKKKLKPITSGISAAANKVTSNPHSNNKKAKADQDLEDDIYDEYVVEAPPHPSELLALGVDPSEIDVNDPDKLRELYRKIKEEGKKTNSVLIAKQRQKEEIEEKKKTREEWKFFDNLTARVDQAVKESQKSLTHLKDSSAVEKLNKPDYELRLTPEQVFRSPSSVKLEKGANDWVDFGEDKQEAKEEQSSGDQKEEHPVDKSETVANELFGDLGIDLRKEKSNPIGQLSKQAPSKPVTETQVESDAFESKTSVIKARPRPKSTNQPQQETTTKREEDPFDTSFVDPKDRPLVSGELTIELNLEDKPQISVDDPFDTSHINF